MNTISTEVADGRRRRRTHSAEFKAHVVAACTQPGVSIAAVAMVNGINANLLRRWVNEAELRGDRSALEKPPARALPPAAPSTSFMPLQLPPSTKPADIRIELRRGATSISVSWPADASSECAAWMRELLR